MSSLILAVNAGSSSLKGSLSRLASQQPLEPADSRLGADYRQLGVPCGSGHVLFYHFYLLFLDNLKDDANIDAADILYVLVCHRVVHGGDFHEPVVINKETYHHIERLSDLVPLYARLRLVPPSSSYSKIWLLQS
jgi:acetate kinase